MSIYIGIDIGSTSISAVALDTDSGQLLGVESAANAAETTSSADRARNRSEWDFSQITDIALSVLRNLVERAGGESVAGIGVTGQQQGCQLYDRATLQPIGPLIGWQDQRAKEPLTAEDERSYLDLMADAGSAHLGHGEPQGFWASGCPLVTGYTASTLTWLRLNGVLPAGAGASTAPEFFVSMLTGNGPVTDPTDAAGWGVFDVAAGKWNMLLVSDLDIRSDLLPELAESCAIAGALLPGIADSIGLAQGVPVTVASGDHQCSFAGTVSDYEGTVAINVGTGGQATIYVPSAAGLRRSGEAIDHGDLELRPYIQKGLLLAGVGIVGGRSFSTLRDFFARTGSQLFGVEPDGDDIYDRLVELAADASSDAEDVKFEPFFTGTRMDRARRGELTGLDPANFTPGNIALALFEGVAKQFRASYETAIETGAKPRTVLTGSGNGLRKNPVLRTAIEKLFGMKMQVSMAQDEAATGAALCAAVASGEFSAIEEASRAVVRHEG